MTGKGKNIISLLRELMKNVNELLEGTMKVLVKYILSAAHPSLELPPNQSPDSNRLK